jgi:hypothetical protein
MEVFRMHEVGPIENVAVVDNWILQLACEAIEFGLISDKEEFKIRTTYGYDFSVYEEYKSLSPGDLTWKSFTKEHVEALIRVLDIIVLYDKIVHDDCRSFVWKNSHASQDLNKILHPIHLSEETLSALNDVLPAEKKIEGEKPDSVDIMILPPDGVDKGRDCLLNFEPFFEGPREARDEEGALFYLSLAMHLGASYWPAPQRAEFLKHHMYSEAGTGFLLRFRDSVDSSLERLITELNIKYDLPDAKLHFAGFGSIVLANCSSTQELLKAATSLRESKEAKRFRSWIMEVGSAMESGNMRKLAAEMKAFKDLLEDIRRGLGLREKDGIGAELQIGLSPTLTIGSSAIKKIFDRLKPKPKHLVFIRKHFERVLEAANIDTHINRLFPGLGENRESFFHNRYDRDRLIG